MRRGRGTPLARRRSLRLPLSYSLRKLWTPRLNTLLTAGRLALGVFVYAAVLLLNEGWKTTLAALPL